MPYTDAPSASLRQRIAVWALFAVTVLAALVAATTSVPSSATGASVSTTSQTAAVNPSEYLAYSNPTDRGSAEGMYWVGATSQESLPAWKWTKMQLDADTNGFLKFLQETPVIISQLLLLMAQFMWTLLLGLIKIAMEAEVILGPAAKPINSAAAALGRQFFALSILFWAFVVWKVVRKLLKGAVVQAFSSALVFLLLFATLWSFTTKADEALKLPADQQVHAAGTLPWFALRAGELATSVTSQLALAEEMFDKPGETANAEGNTPTCAAYITKIHEAYLAGDRNPALVSMSKLWEQTQYKSWTYALFGQPAGGRDMGSRVMCHWAEASNSTTAAEQQRISSLSYGVEVIPDPSTTTYVVFGPLDENDRRRAMVAWAACEWNGSKWQTTDEWLGVWREEIKRDSNDGDAYTDRRCRWAFGARASSGDLFKDPSDNNDDPFNVYGGRIDKAMGKGKNIIREQLRPAESFASSFSGGNIADRIIQSLLALVVAVLFLYALGFMAVGLIIAQLMLVVLLMLFPVTLALFAIGSPRAKAMAKLTGTTAVTQAFFLLILTSLIVLSAVFQDLVLNFGATGLLGTILVGLAPIAAFFIVRKLLQTMGMGDVLKPSGAVGFLSAAALNATGDAKFQKMARVDEKGRNLAQRAGDKSMGAGVRGFTKARKAGHWTKKRVSKEGRDERKAMRAARVEEYRNKQRDKLAARIENSDPNKKARLSKMRNWVSEKKLNSDAFSKTMARAGAAAQRLEQSKVYTGTGKAIGQHRNVVSSWETQRLVANGTEEPLDTNNHEYANDETAKSEARLERAKLDAAIRRDPANAPQLRGAAFGETAAAAAAITLGANSEDGFYTPQQLAQTKSAIAITRGLNPEDLVLTSSGIVMPLAGNMTAQDKRNLSVDELRDFVYWLPESDRKLRDGESPDQYGARMLAIGKERGFVTPDGKRVDVFEKMGLNIKNEDDLNRIEAWRAGGEDKLLDKKVFRATNASAEKRMVDAAYAWVSQNDVARRTRMQDVQVLAFEEMQSGARELPAMQEVLDAHQQELSDQAAKAAQVAVRFTNARRSPDADTSVVEREMQAEAAALDAKLRQLTSTMFDQLNAAVAVEIDLGVATGDLDSEDKIAELMLSRLQFLKDQSDELETLASRVWRGDSDAAAKLTESVQALQSIVAEHSSQTASRTIAAESDLRAAFQQHVATESVRRTSKMPTSREVVDKLMATMLP